MTNLALLWSDLLQTDPGTAEASGFLHQLRPIDQIGLGVVSVFLLLGLVRGLWWQVIRLVGLLAAGLVARALAPRWSPSVEEASGLPAVVSQGLVWFAVFVLALAGASLLGLIGKKSLETMQLGLVDRFGGGLAGVLTGLVLHAALLLGLSYLGPQPWTANTLAGTGSQTLLRLVSMRAPVLLDRDSVAAREIRAWLGEPGEVPAEEEHEQPSLEALPEAGAPAPEAPGAEGAGGAPPAEPRPIEASSPRRVR